LLLSALAQGTEETGLGFPRTGANKNLEVLKLDIAGREAIRGTDYLLLKIR
jgi:hypothetical protein